MADQRGYVVLFPHSLTNKTANYQVVSYTLWMRFVNREESTFPVDREFSTSEEAYAYQDKLNKTYARLAETTQETPNV